MPKFIVLVFIFALLFFVFKSSFPKKKSLSLSIKNQNFDIEIAKSISDLSRGLGVRATLCPNCGMLFVFPFTQNLTFWMKDTLIPLDMIFLDSQGTVINITTASPEPNTPDSQLTLYKSDTPALYCLELNAGISQKLGLKKGDRINLNGI